MNLAKMAVKIISVVLSGEAQEIQKVVDEHLSVLTVSQYDEFSSAIADANLLISSKACDKGYTEIQLAYILMASIHDDSGVIELFADEHIDKHESVELADWSCFAKSVCKSWLRVQDDESLSTYYFVVKTNCQVGNTPMVKTDLAMAESRDVEYLGPVIAQQVNGGLYDSELYGEPCFDADGFITYPESVVEVSSREFKVLSTHISFDGYEGYLENLNPEVVAYVENEQ